MLNSQYRSDLIQFVTLVAVTDDNDVANKKYVDDALDGLDPSGGFTFKGTADVTGAAPSVLLLLVTSTST